MITLIPQETRGEGHTARQIEQAPGGAIFVWCGRKIDYPVAIARQLKRDDVTIMPDRVLHDGAIELAGREEWVVIDHALSYSRNDVRYIKNLVT